MQRLKQDLLSLDSALKDFTRKNSSHIPDTPSWKYPELTACSVDAKRCLETSAEDGQDLLVLELLHDRTLFLLQCVLKGSFSRGTKSVPLSLATASKKLLKAIEEDFALKHQEQQQVLSGANSQQTPVLTDPLKNPLSVGLNPPWSSVSVQTVETCLSICAKCVDVQKVLEEASGIAAHAVSVCAQDPTHKPPTHPQNWPKGEEFDSQSWLSIFQGNISSVVEVHQHMVERCVELAERVKALQLQLKHNQEVLHSKEEEVIQAAQLREAEAVEAEQKRITLVSKHQQEVETKENNLHRLEEELQKFQKEIKSLKDSKVELLNMLSEKTSSVRALEQEVDKLKEEAQDLGHRLQTRQVELTDTSSSLQDQLEKLEQFEQLLLSKENHTATLTQRLKDLQRKHTSLIDHLEGLEEEKERLAGQLQASLRNQEESQQSNTDLSNQLVLLQSTLSQQKAEIENGVREIAHYTEKIAKMTEAREEMSFRLAQLQKDFSESESKCRLLMDYPSLDPLRSKVTIRELGEGEAQHHVSANTVRILLLEEQNKDLRLQLMPSSSDRGPFDPQIDKTKLWQPGLFRKASEQSLQSFSSQHLVDSTESYTRPSRDQRFDPTNSSSEPQLRTSSAKYKGHLGRLATALQSSYKSQDSKHTPDYHAWS